MTLTFTHSNPHILNTKRRRLFLHTMLPDNPLTRFFVISFLISFRLVAPLAILYLSLPIVLITLRSTLSATLPVFSYYHPLLHIYALAEALYVVSYLFAKQRLIKTYVPPAPTPLEQVRIILKETLDGLKADARAKGRGGQEQRSVVEGRLNEFLGGWFDRVNGDKQCVRAEELGRGDIEDLLSSQ